MADIVKLVLRIPSDIWEKLKAWAEEDDRSLNGQIVHLLKRAVEQREKSE